MSRQDLERIWAEVRTLLINPDEHWPSQLGIELARRGDTEGLAELRRIAREQMDRWRTVHHVVSDQFREVMGRGRRKGNDADE
jgi:molybdenum-dependent DNA-binding transcriptional regulator ModE